MNQANAEMLQSAIDDLGDLADEVMFVGGATVEFWISDDAAPEFRPTDDVDIVVQISTQIEYYQLDERLKERGFRNHPEGGVICRYKHRDSEVILDAIPTEASIVGFTNDWLKVAFVYAEEVSLPSGKEIRAITPPYLLATKLEAFATRGKDDLYGSRDFEDVIALIDGREELIDEVSASPKELRSYVSQELERIGGLEDFESGLEGALPMAPETPERVELVLLPRIEALKACRP